MPSAKQCVIINVNHVSDRIMDPVLYLGQVQFNYIYLDLELSELTQLDETQLKELHGIKPSIIPLLHPSFRPQFSHGHSVQLKELEDLTAAIKSQPRHPRPPPLVTDYSQLKLNIQQHPLFTLLPIYISIYISENR